MKKLAKYLDKTGLTRTEFGKRAKISQPFLSQLMGRKRRPSWPMMEKIRKATGGYVKPEDWV